MRAATAEQKAEQKAELTAVGAKLRVRWRNWSETFKVIDWDPHRWYVWLFVQTQMTVN
jgi:hypothetical protein